MPVKKGAKVVTGGKRAAQERVGVRGSRLRQIAPSFFEHTILGCRKGAMRSPCWLRCLYGSGRER
jgi:hypothetical protein